MITSVSNIMKVPSGLFFVTLEQVSLVDNLRAIYRPSSGMIIREIDLGYSTCDAMSISAEGERIGIVSESRIRVGDFKTGVLVDYAFGEVERIFTYGRDFLCQREDGLCAVLHKGELIPAGKKREILAASLKGEFLLTANEDFVFIEDSNCNEVFVMEKRGYSLCVDWNDTVVALGEVRGPFRVFDMSTKEVLCELTPESGWHVYKCFLRNDGFVVVVEVNYKTGGQIRAGTLRYNSGSNVIDYNAYYNIAPSCSCLINDGQLFVSGTREIVSTLKAEVISVF